MYIKRKERASIPEVNGAVSDTWNVVDKTKNAPSMRLVEDRFKYSTDEKVIGEWIDGKPLYRKVFEINNVTPNVEGTIDISDLNYAMIKLDGVYAYGSTGSMAINSYYENTHRSVAWVNGTALSYRISVTGATYAIIIAEYTKITD